MARRRPAPSRNDQLGLLCRTCGALLASAEEQQQGECDACYDLFAAPPPRAEPPDALLLEWLQAIRQSDDTPAPATSDVAPTQHGGKWLVVVGFENFERVWAAIRQATEAGQLGPHAQVVPARAYRFPAAWSGPHLVIEVATDDATDEADVWRVRQAIRALGITAALTYRADHPRSTQAVERPTAPRTRRMPFD